MTSFFRTFISIFIILLSVAASAICQDLKRELSVGSGASVEIVNKYGRVNVKAVDAFDGKTISRLTASSPGGIGSSDIKISNGGAKVLVEPKDPKKRIDITLTVSERISLKIETTDGAVEIGGNFAAVKVTTDTGTISADVPLEDLKYEFHWTESKPRFLAAIELSEVKERSRGRFEIKGKYVRSTKANDEDKAADEGKIARSRAVSLDLTTARGIILLNVPPNEVMSDLRERPLTNAAKAIIRSGDSLLMEAIRRASPKYFGDYSRTLPPISMEPKFATERSQINNPSAQLKTAFVRVADLNNRSIADIKTVDLEVIEDGKPREIVSVEPSTAPFNLVLLLDVSGSVDNYVNFIRKAARSFVDTVGRDDKVSIITFNEDVKVLSGFTTDKTKLSASLDTFDAGGGTAYYDALGFTIAETLRPLRGERTAIVILTDGDDNGSFLAFDSLIGSIQESGALIYPLYVPSELIAAAESGADIDPMRKKYMSLSAKSEGEGDKLAKTSGGIYYPITQISQIQKAYEDIVLQLRSAYRVTFRSDIATGKGVSPRLRIKINKENAYATITGIVAK